jgi:hypothetical protein
MTGVDCADRCFVTGDMPPASYEVLYHGQLQVYPRSELSPMVSL